MATPIRHRLLFPAAPLIALTAGLLFANEPTPPKPPPGPAPAPVDRSQATDQPTEEQRLVREADSARTRADLLRAAYEQAHRAGNVPKDAAEPFNEVVAAYTRAIDRPVASPQVADIVFYCHLRLAGAYQYTGQFDKAIAQAKQAAHDFAGTRHEINALYTVGLIHLQARHDPKQALPWLKRARQLAEANLPDPDARVKWLTATDQAIRRCEQELSRDK